MVLEEMFYIDPTKISRVGARGKGQEHVISVVYCTPSILGTNVMVIMTGGLICSERAYACRAPARDAVYMPTESILLM